MFEEIYSEILHEYSAYPVRMIAEAVQFVLLIVIVWVVAMGWGKRKGFVANMLSERAERTDREIETASHAAEDLGLPRRARASVSTHGGRSTHARRNGASRRRAARGKCARGS